MTARTDRSGTFTGRHMLGIMLAFFGTIIAVNLVMATLANTSWTGFVVKNSYVASQEFNRNAKEGRAQAALGWKSKLTITRGEVRYSLTDSGNRPVALNGVTVSFRHPAYEAEDKSVILARVGDGEFAAAHMPRDGVWIVEVNGDAGLERPYREIRRIIIARGVLQ